MNLEPAQGVLPRLGLACGVAAPIVWLAVVSVCGALSRGHTPLEDAISLLSARESPTGLLMRYLGYGVSGAFTVAFGLALAWRSRFDWFALGGALLLVALGVARILGGVHACDPGCEPFRPSPDQLRHEFALRAAWLLAVVAAFYWGVLSNRYPVLKRSSALGIGAGSWTLVFLVMGLTAEAQLGLWQRLAHLALGLWQFVFALLVWRAGPATAQFATATPPPR